MSEVKPCPKWELKYDNDTGPDDDSFQEWIEVGPARIYLSRHILAERAEQVASANLIAAAPDLYAAVKLALRNEEARLYMLPASDDYEVSAQKDILSAAIGHYRAALRKADGQ
jgi:hypothetical protein